MTIISITRCLTVGAVLLGLVCTSHAEYYGFNVPSGADIITQEVRYPAWAESTYNAIWSSYINGPHGTGVYFYGGVPHANPTDPERWPASIIWSFWPVGHPVTPGDTIKAAWCNPQMYAPLSVGEGASGKVSGQWPQIKPGAWYQFVLHIWHPLDKPGQAFVGQWLHDPAENHWYHLATMAVPFDATGFNGQGGFIEDFGHGNRLPRRTDFRHVYGHTPAGGWESAAKFTPSVRQKGEKGKAELIEDNTAAYFETCSRADYKPGVLDYDNDHKEVTLTLRQPAKPEFPAPSMTHIEAWRSANQILVTWAVPTTAAPQLSYKAEALDSSGKMIAVRQESDPEARQTLLDVDPANVANIKLTLGDIFDQTRTVAVSLPQVMALSSAQSLSGTMEPGLDFSYVEAPNGKPAEAWNTLSAFAELTKPQLHGTANYPDLSQRRRRTNYALKYTGFLRAPASGIYRFRLSSYDGSRLLIDGTPMVDNDGVHSYTDKFGVIGLAAGLHAVNIDYFRNTNRGEGSTYGDRLLLEWEGPGLPFQFVSREAFRRSTTAGMPIVHLITPVVSSVLPNTGVTLDVTVAPASTDIVRVTYYVDDTLWAARSSAPWSTVVTLPKGMVNLHARILAKDGTMYDSPPVRVECQQSNTTPWHLVQIGTPAPRRPQGAAVKDKDSIYLVGDGLNFAWQEINGDATLIAHVAQRPNPNESMQEDSTRPDGDWLGGLLVRSDLLAHDTFLGDAFCTVYARADDSTHLQCPHDHNGGGPVAGPDLGHLDWLKLERRGDTFTASVSNDGQKWEVKGTRTIKLPHKLDAGVFTYDKPGFNNNSNAWRLDRVHITQP